MYTTVIFDLGEVFIQGMHGSQYSLAKIAGCEPKHMWTQINLRPRRYALFEGRISEQQYWQELIQINEWSCTPAQLAGAMRENFTELPGTRKIIETLYQAGYKLGLLSIQAREWVEYCEPRHNYHRHFHAVQYSYEVGLRKPDPRVFQMMLDALGSTPAETVFVDDHPKNIEGAKHLGIRAILHVSASQTAEELGSIIGMKFDLAP